MYVVIFQEHGKEDKPLFTASNINTAKAGIADKLGIDEKDVELERDEESDTIYRYNIGDADYTVYALSHWS